MVQHLLCTGCCRSADRSSRKVTKKKDDFYSTNTLFGLALFLVKHRAVSENEELQRWNDKSYRNGGFTTRTLDDGPMFARVNHFCVLKGKTRSSTERRLLDAKCFFIAFRYVLLDWPDVTE